MRGLAEGVRNLGASSAFPDPVSADSASVGLASSASVCSDSVIPVAASADPSAKQARPKGGPLTVVLVAVLAVVHCLSLALAPLVWWFLFFASMGLFDALHLELGQPIDNFVLLLLALVVVLMAVAPILWWIWLMQKRNWSKSLNCVVALAITLAVNVLIVVATVVIAGVFGR